VYIGQKDSARAVSEHLRKFGRAGAIHSIGDGRITGIASRRNDKYTDLIILVEPSGKPTEMIHYRNDGRRFEIVENNYRSE
ncbi:MAG: hypothetical protein JXN60_01845, partial [Lentisphaerae bacterium]|nr:hypothetical protein [Lentisphaerota bacterium]